MGRSRSRSPRRDSYRRRSRSRSRDRDRRRDRYGRRSRSRSPQRRRHRSRSYSPRRRSPSPRRGGDSRDRYNQQHNQYNQRRAPSPERPYKLEPETQEIDESQLEGKSEEEIEMMKLMGFSNFDTTKGKKVKDNEEGEAHIIVKRRYRQYMNRKGGFNRPLDFIA